MTTPRTQTALAPWPLTDAEADAIEAQLAGPDLTELRAKVTALPDPEVHEWTPVEQAAWKLIRLVDGTDGAA